MNKSGISTVTQFVLLGFPGPWKMQIIFFSIILLVYILTLTGNIAIICAVRWDHRLHTPMYVFLANFSFLEVWYVTCTVPSMLVNFLSKTKTISFSGCFTQSTSSFPWAQLNASSSVSWLMIATLPSVVHCTIPPS